MNTVHLIQADSSNKYANVCYRTLALETSYMQITKYSNIEQCCVRAFNQILPTYNVLLIREKKDDFLLVSLVTVRKSSSE